MKAIPGEVRVRSDGGGKTNRIRRCLMGLVLFTEVAIRI